MAVRSKSRWCSECQEIREPTNAAFAVERWSVVVFLMAGVLSRGGIGKVSVSLPTTFVVTVM